jgi:hypothetical protein
MATPSLNDNEMAVTTWAELLRSVEDGHGLKRVTMATLRELEGAQRVGKHVLTAIDTKLSQLGLGYLPDELPNRQEAPVMLYRVGTPAADTIRAIRLTMLTGVVDMSLYHVLLQLNKMPDPTQVLLRGNVEESANGAVAALTRLLNELTPGIRLVTTPVRPEEMV